MKQLELLPMPEAAPPPPQRILYRGTQVRTPYGVGTIDARMDTDGLWLVAVKIATMPDHIRSNHKGEYAFMHVQEWDMEVMG